MVSIESPSEFLVALQAGVRWIDVKNPSLGSLGRPLPSTIEQLIEQVRRRSLHPTQLDRSDALTLSIALGELLEYQRPVPVETEIFEHWKIGLAGCSERVDWQSQVGDWTAACQRPGQMILVHYADQALAHSPSFEAICDLSLEIESQYVLIDTWQKGGKRLTDWIEEDRLRDMILFARDRGLKISLAGSLQLSDIVRLHSLKPDVWAVRSAACVEGDRSRPLCPERLGQLMMWQRSMRNGIPSNSEFQLKPMVP